MTIELNEQDGGKILFVRVTGKLSKEDYQQFTPRVEALIQQFGKIRILFEMHDFHGWKAGALWEDIKFDARHYADIERLALVGDKKWERGMGTFCRPFTTARIRYFDLSEAAAARQWIMEGIEAPV